MTEGKCVTALSFALALCVSMALCAADEGKPTTRVDSAQAFVDALGPDRVIEITAGTTIRLDQARRGRGKYFRWAETADDEYELVVRDCANLEIRAAEGEQPFLCTKNTSANVLRFENCSSLMLSGLRIGHDPRAGGCDGGVIAMENCESPSLRVCTLFGCGTEGLILNKVKKLTVEKSVIEKCTVGLLSTSDCEDLTFRESAFRDTGKYHGFGFTDSVNIRFVNCVVESNVAEGDRSLFKTNLNVEEARIVFEHGAIRKNRAAALCEPADMLKTIDAEVADNVWTTDPRAQAVVLAKVGTATITAGDIQPEQWALEDLIRRELVRHYIKAQNITCTKEELTVRKQQLEENAATVGIPMGEFDEVLQREEICKEKITERARTDERVQAFIRNNPAYFDGTAVTVRYITIECDPMSSTVDQKAARAELEKIRADIVAGKLTFEDAMRQSSPPPAKSNSWNTMSINYSEMIYPGQEGAGPSIPAVPPLAAAAFETKAGQVSPIVQTEFGFHFVKVIDRKDGKGTPIKIASWPNREREIARMALRYLAWNEVLLQGMGDCPIVIVKPGEAP